MARYFVLSHADNVSMRSTRLMFLVFPTPRAMPKLYLLRFMFLNVCNFKVDFTKFTRFRKLSSHLIWSELLKLRLLLVLSSFGLVEWLIRPRAMATLVVLINVSMC